MRHWNLAGALGIAFAAAALLASAALPARAADTRSFTPAQRAEIGDVVRAYLLDHPEVLVDAMNALQAKQDKAAREKAEAVIKAHPNEIFNDGYSFVAGNPHAKVTMVEFFDYNCAYCRKAFDKMMTLAAPNSNVRFIFKEFPILSPESEVAARAAFAAGKQGKYLQFHKAMMSHPGRANAESIDEVAKSIGLSLTKLHKDMTDPKIAAEVQANLKLGADLSFDGTPSFIVGDKVMSGWSEDDLDKLIADGAKG
jgi:protein-disulfide isomerase